MKRLIIYIILSLATLIIGLTIESNSIIQLTVLPYSIVGDGLRYLSLSNNFFNVISLTLYLVISLTPLIFGIILYFRKSIMSVDYIFLPVISILSFILIYAFINPHVIMDSLNPIIISMVDSSNYSEYEMIVNSSYAYITYLMVGIYLVLRLYYNHKLNSIKVFNLLINIIIGIYLLSFFMIEFPTFVSILDHNISSYETFLNIIKLAFIFVSYTLVIYMIEVFKQFIINMSIDGFNKSLYSHISKLYKLSVILLVFLLAIQLFINLYQIIFIKHLLNLQFTIDVPLSTIIIALTFLLIGKYIQKVELLNEEHNLII